MGRIYKYVAVFAVSLACICAVAVPSEAALADRYQKSFVGGSSAAAVKQSGKGSAIPQKKVTPLPKEFAAKVKKNTDRYIAAFYNDEFAHRYYYGRLLSKNKHPLTKEQLLAMQDELKGLNKELSASALALAKDIKTARAALPYMSDKDKLRLARILIPFVAMPANAAGNDGPIDASALDGIGAGLTGIADTTANIGYSSINEMEAANARMESKIYSGLIIGAAAVGVVVSGAAVVGGLAMGVAAIGGATTAGAAVGGAVVTTIGFVGGGLNLVESSIGFVDEITEKQTNTKDLHEINKTLGKVNMVLGGSPKTTTEVVKVVVDTYDINKTEIIDHIYSDEPNPKSPGKAGVNKVVSAENSAQAGDSSNSGEDNGRSGGGH